ncbi:MAG: AAA family ATPase [Flavobacteriaceae bacterium]
MMSISKRYIEDSTEDHAEVVRLWIYRILNTPKGRSKFMRGSCFSDDDVAEFIGMGKHLDNQPEKFDEKAVRAEFSERARRAEEKQPKLPDYIEENFCKLAQIAGLKETELAVLKFIAIREPTSVLTDALDVLGTVSYQSSIALVARALKLPRKQVARAVAHTGPLVQCGLIKYEERYGRCKLPRFFNGNAAEFLITEDFDTSRLLAEIVQQALPPTLSYSDYPNLKSTLALLRPYLRKALKNRENGVNILLWGPPGTGKTELSRILARELRCPIHEIASGDSSGDPVHSISRLNSLRLANTLVGKRSMLVFDEVEDVFNDGATSGPTTAQSRKAWMNRMLENNRIPTIWISNDIVRMDNANLRRFDFIIEVPIPPKNQREKAYQKICNNIVSHSTIKRIAEAEKVSPAVVARATRVITAIHDQIPENTRDKAFLQLVENTLKAQGQRDALKKSKSSPLPLLYNPSYVNTDVNLTELGETLTKESSCRMCLYGPPGTGKTSFAHWVAVRTGKPLHIKRASDILGPYVGMTERNLADAFKRAHKEGAILLLDEVDTFLQNRQNAVRSWEVSEVNEFLTQMEAFKGIFIASTNLMDNLDQAALRRFDLKILFDFLKPEQVQRLLLAHCLQLDLGEPSEALLDRIAALSTLTPGDFANAARQHRFRKFKSAEHLVDALAAECRLKKIPSRGRLGFG